MAHPDLNLLLDKSLGFAHKMLKEHGEFFPFAYSLDLGGKVAMYGVDTGTEHPPSQQVIDILSSHYKKKAEARELRAVAICMDVRVVPPGERDKIDAICVGLEHETGEVVDVFEPYRKKWFGRLQYSELFAVEREAQFFGRSG
jgi:hypothetical protein